VNAIRKCATAPGIAVTTTERPVAAQDEVLIAVEAAGLCGTDLHIADWTPGYESMAGNLPVTLGHEFAGRVIEGPPDLFGRRVVIRPSTVCQSCSDCGDRRHDLCRKRRGIGIHRDGGFAPLAVVPGRNCIPVDERLDAEVAALAEPLTVAMEAVRRSGLGAGDRLLIIGPGPIGALAALAAEPHRPAAIVIAGRGDEARLAVMRGLGFDHAFDTAEGELESQLAAAGLPRHFDRVIEAAGSASAVGMGLRHLAPGGVLTIAGIHARPVEIDLTSLVRSRQEVRGSYRAAVAAWPDAIALLQADPERFRRLITHRLGLSEAEAAFGSMRRRESLKVMLRPESAG
jgi:threonine dehydrogenase-like Zn-dependent dehydrogenase